MDPFGALIGTAVLLALLGVAVVAFVVPLVRRRPERPEHDDQLRAGRDAETDAGVATDRATGSTAWMRPGGGGV